jgi:hypothetical protein
VIGITWKSGIERMLIQMRDRKGHNSTTIMERLEEFQVTLLPHRPYSLEISSYNFFSFGWSKDAMPSQ